jgi:hypothetical protein
MKNLLILFIALLSVQANANDAKPTRRFSTKNYLGVVGAPETMIHTPGGLVYSMQIEPTGSSNVAGFSVALAKKHGNLHMFHISPSIYVGRKISSSVSAGILGGVNVEGHLHLLTKKFAWSKDFMGGVYVALDICEGKYRVSYSIQAAKDTARKEWNYSNSVTFTAFLG